MAKYEINFSCGHSEIHQIYGPHRDRERRIEWLEAGVCSECYRKELEKLRAEATREAAEKAGEFGLPELKGTPKQVAWAETIRIEKLEKIREIRQFDQRHLDHVQRAIGADPGVPHREEMESGYQALAGVDSARFWIDNRFEAPWNLLKIGIRMVETPEKAVAKQMEDKAAAEATVRPEKPVTETVAEIRVKPDRVEVHFPERVEAFRLLMRGLGFVWSAPVWVRKTTTTTGAPADRAAEVGHKALASGFCIRIYDEDIRAAAISGDYEPEHTRWIMARTSGNYAGWLSIWWKRGEDFYREAKRLPGARWSRPSMVVPARHFEEVMDFAEIHKFRISDRAMELIEAAREARDKALVVSVEDVGADPEPDTKARPKLEAPENPEVDDEFKDDPA